MSVPYEDSLTAVTWKDKEGSLKVQQDDAVDTDTQPATARRANSPSHTSRPGTSLGDNEQRAMTPREHRNIIPLRSVHKPTTTTRPCIISTGHTKKTYDLAPLPEHVRAPPPFKAPPGKPPSDRILRPRKVPEDPKKAEEEEKAKKAIKLDEQRLEKMITRLTRVPKIKDYPEQESHQLDLETQEAMVERLCQPPNRSPRRREDDGQDDEEEEGEEGRSKSKRPRRLEWEEEEELVGRLGGAVPPRMGRDPSFLTRSPRIVDEEELKSIVTRLNDNDYYRRREEKALKKHNGVQLDGFSPSRERMEMEFYRKHKMV